MSWLLFRIILSTLTIMIVVDVVSPNRTNIIFAYFKLMFTTTKINPDIINSLTNRVKMMQIKMDIPFIL